ncbi:hypothetical protein [Parashewanella tropica]|uniref:hypothetical protein n=1 Tax=Parashewanella tropica TaxID=2547970 RepID=UPI001059809E|nr:hypothetical protein [Parashewanella tropica]
MAMQLIPMAIGGKLTVQGATIAEEDTSTPVELYYSNSSQFYMSGGFNAIKQDSQGGDYTLDFHVPASADNDIPTSATTVNFLIGFQPDGAAPDKLGTALCTMDMSYAVASKALTLSNANCKNSYGLDNYQFNVSFGGQSTTTLDDISSNSAQLPSFDIAVSAK